MDALDKQRWIALSPLLDELLDLEEPARSRRLDEIRAGDSAMAEHLEALLVRDAALDEERFLEQPAAEALQGTSIPLHTLGAGRPGSPDMTGESLGPYLLERELGQGGMGTVWLAKRADGRFEGQVAVKFLRSGLFGKGDSGRFEREGQILARLSHPHIARLLDAGVHRGHQPYLVLEFVDGLPIDRYCHVNGLTIEARIRLFLDVLAAVAHAHQRLILHRDLKPSNILVTHQGEVKLLDFGIAKLLDDATEPAAATELTQRAGSAFTPQYAAPEQVQQDDVTTATDVYALGVLLYQLLGGRHPTADDTQTHLDRLRAVVELVPKRLSDVAAQQLDPVIAKDARSLHGDLDTVIAKALKKRPAERYANAEQLAVDLRHWLAHEPITARPDSRLYVLNLFVRRHRWAVAASSAAVLALLGLTTFSVIQAHRAEQAEHQAQQRRQQADDLLSYMLGEFADKLRPVGRLELLDNVGSKALSYLAQDANATPQERLQRAKALTVIAEVRVTKRNLAEALEPAQAARRLLAGAPPSADLTAEWRKAQGAAAFWVGHVHYYERKFDLATTAWEAYRDAEQAWVDAAPRDLDALLELSYAHNSLGTARMESGDLAGASAYFRHSIELKKRVLEALGPNATAAGRISLADSMSWLGTTLMWRGLDEAADRSFAEGAAMIAGVRKTSPDDGGWAYNDAIMRRWRSQTQLALGHREAALREAKASGLLLDALVAKDPANVQWKQNGLRGQLYEMEIVGTRMAPRERLDRLASLKTQLDALARERPALLRDVDARLRHARLTAQALSDLGRTQEAITALEASVTVASPAIDERPNDVRMSLHYIQTRLLQVEVSKAAGALSTNAYRETLCRDIVNKTDKLTGLIGVHQQITRAWVEAQSCLGQGARDDVKRTAAWLERDRSINASF